MHCGQIVEMAAIDSGKRQFRFRLDICSICVRVKVNLGFCKGKLILIEDAMSINKCSVPTINKCSEPTLN